MFEASSCGKADHGVDREPRVIQESGCLAGFGDTASFDDHPFGRRSAPAQLGKGRVEVVADLAADASVGQLDDVVAIGIASVDEGAIDVDLADVVDDHRDPLRRSREHAVDHRGLARAEPAAQHGHRNCRLQGHVPSVP